MYRFIDVDQTVARQFYGFEQMNARSDMRLATDGDDQPSPLKPC